MYFERFGRQDVDLSSFGDGQALSSNCWLRNPAITRLLFK
jgi:hypothetical protein